MKFNTLVQLLSTVDLVLSNPLAHSNGDKDQIPIEPIPPTSHPVPKIPTLGLGLWNSKDDDATHAILSAFNTTPSYTHLDGAAAYSNEPFVGKALSASTTPPRHTYWLTSKLWNTMHAPANVPLAFNKTLQDLNTTYLDLYLMHWPVAFKPNAPKGRTILDPDTKISDTWKAMELLVDAFHASGGAYGARHIGISNFSPRQIDELLRVCRHCPTHHEFETHPYLQQQEFVDWHAKHNVTVIAYSPLANLNPTYKDVAPELPPILEDEFWVDLARDKNCTVAQAVLGWGIARGTVVIPKSVHAKRIQENIGAVKVAKSFTKEEMVEVERQDRKVRFNNPSKSWGTELFEGLDGGKNRFLATGDGEL